MIDVNMNYFRAAAECQSTEETRYYLNGVYISPHPEKGVLLTATDGHRLITLHDEAGKCAKAKIVSINPKAIDAKAYNEIKKAMPGEAPRIVIGDDGIVTVGTYRSLKSCFIDGTFPDWTMVIPPVLAKAKEGKYCPASYRQNYVAAFGRIAKMLSPDNCDTSSIRIISFTESDPSLIRFGSIDHAFGILMPMRASSSNELPTWMKPVLEPAKPAAEPAPSVATAPKAKKAKPAARRPAAKRKPARVAKKKTAKRRAA
jgi:DNA polymerase III beta subunit, central domain